MSRLLKEKHLEWLITVRNKHYFSQLHVLCLPLNTTSFHLVVIVKQNYLLKIYKVKKQIKKSYGCFHIIGPVDYIVEDHIPVCGCIYTVVLDHIWVIIMSHYYTSIILHLSVCLPTSCFNWHLWNHILSILTVGSKSNRFKTQELHLNIYVKFLLTIPVSRQVLYEGWYGASGPR